ncbi:hypothetical protein [Vibrio metschnikovii]|uniref:hypothetical protein n=1 Tax=Vibrio metschnikovii TaxID=28172 RepID=UPI001302A6D0|nr:hypothetical protein [Vibrio metschnikovii]
MRTAINTCLTLLILMMIFLSSLAFATDANCPIGYDMGSRSWDGSIYGDRPYICFQTNRCKARPSDVSLCFTSDTTCVATFLTTGEQCTETESVQSGTIFPGGDIVTPPDGGGSDGGDGGDIDSGGLAQSVPRYINWGTGGSSNLGRAFEALIYNNNQHSNTDRDLYRTWSNRINNSINSSSTVLRPDLNRIDNSVKFVSEHLGTVSNKLSGLGSELTQKSILDSIQTGNNQDKVNYDETFVYQSRQLNHNDTLINRVDTTNLRLDNVKQTLDNNFSAFMSFFARRMDSLESAILSGGSADSNVNMDGLTQLVSEALQANQILLNQQTDAITSSVSGLGTDLKGIKDALTTKFDDRAFVGKVDFDVDGVLYKSSLYNDLFIEREQLENEYEQLLDKVKNMFSFDTSDLNSGEYKDHILDFLAPDGSGRQFSFKSGVFPAFIQQANLIATILLFIAAVIAVRVIMGGSK